MTQEFEANWDEWQESRTIHNPSCSCKFCFHGGWEASRESLKAKLLSDEMVAKTRFAIAEHYHNVGYDSEALAKAALKSVVEQIYG